MRITETVFHRVFSKSMYKTLQLPLGEMTFTKDFVHTDRGDLYPLLAKDPDCTESVEHNAYQVEHGLAERMFTRFFPFATYEISFVPSGGGTCGFSFHLPKDTATLLCTDHAVSFADADKTETVPFAGGELPTTMLVSCRPGAFDLFFFVDGRAQFFHTFFSERFAESNREQTIRRSFVAVLAGDVLVTDVRSYIDCGISQADIRPICYENGDPIYENGKVYFTATIRMQAGGMQGVFSWTPSTSDIALTGALFFDCGDGFCRNYLASSILYHREKRAWYLWTSSFEHKHLLCYATFAGEPRFGVSVIDVSMMEPVKDGDGYTDFVGFRGDEDADFYYNAEEKQWYLAICRLCPETGRYRYAFFRSDQPFTGYTYVGRGYEGSETGGGFLRFNGEIAFVCGNDRPGCKANYRIYTADGMQEARFDFSDGGFRGWGALIPVTMGSRQRCFWLTFDRHNGSDYNWSYGNLYGFEAE